MVVCLVSRHTHDDTTKRRPRNGTVGPEIAIITSILALDPNPCPKIHHSKHHLRLERHRLLFDELVLGQDRVVRGRCFFGTLRRRDGARVRSFAKS